VKPKKPSAEDRWFARHFPTIRARDAADRTIDAMPVSASMADYLDAWLGAYVAAGGMTDVVP
jgi:hypothetical protein